MFSFQFILPVVLHKARKIPDVGLIRDESQKILLESIFKALS